MSPTKLPLRRRFRRKLGVIYRGIAGSPAQRRERVRSEARERRLRAAAAARADEQQYWRHFARELHLAPMEELRPDAELADLVEHAGLLDHSWYAARVGTSLRDALEHYRSIGAADNRCPHPLLDPNATHLTEQLQARLRTREVDALPWHPAIDQTSLANWIGPGPDLLRRAAALVTAEERCDALAAAPIRAVDLPRSEDDLRFTWLITRAFDHPDTFALVRIIGNDLPPRHLDGQSEANLRFILEHEPELPGCRKLFLLNRILDPDIRERLRSLLSEHQAEVEEIPFLPGEYAARGWRVREFGKPGLVYGRTGSRQPRLRRHRIVDHTYHDKNLYVMHNNGARNVAIEMAHREARWALPFDGNCFLTEDAYRQLRTAISDAPHLPYHQVPMARIDNNASLLHPSTPHDTREEPQLVFRDDAVQRFDPDQRYGRRPKVELLVRLRVSGPWDTWRNEPWEPDWPEEAPDVGRVGVAGWVARLASGKPALEHDDHERMVSRMTSIQTALQRVDEGRWGEPLWRSPPWADGITRGENGAVGGAMILPGPLVDSTADAAWTELRNNMWQATQASDHEQLRQATNATAQKLLRRARRDGSLDLPEAWVAWELRWLRSEILDPKEMSEALAQTVARASSAAEAQPTTPRGRSKRALRREIAALIIAVAADRPAAMLDRSRRLAARRHDRFVLDKTTVGLEELSLWMIAHRTLDAVGIRLETAQARSDELMAAAVSRLTATTTEADITRLTALSHGSGPGLRPG